MPTLQELKKQQGLTNASIGRALGCSASVAGMIMQGRHIHVYHDEQIVQLAKVLNITFERCWYAMCESYNTWNGTPDAKHQRADELRYDALTELQGQMPDMSIEIQQPRPLATVDGYIAIEGKITNET